MIHPCPLPGVVAIDPSLALPPGFRALPGGDDPWETAVRAAAAGAEPGSVFWDGAHGRCRAAFVFAPDRPLAAGVVLDLGALALFDAIAVLAPPQVPVHLVPPDGLAVDGGRVATLRASEGPAGSDGVPDWAVLGLDAAVGVRVAAPGETPDRTSLAEEGFGGVTPADLLTHMSRHLLGWIEAWREDGAAALAKAVAQRASPMVVT